MSPPDGAGSGGLVLGVIVPCRNEARVIERRLRNLALGEWPATLGRHQLVVVDDGSSDGTAERARELCARLFAGAPVDARVLCNPGPAGKAGAMRAGLRELEAAGAELVVLTDADVVHRPGSLPALERAFRARPELGMACARQEFVADLADDGRCLGAGGGEPVPAGEPYDRWTAGVRRRESRRGRVFSVHGQLLAWRAGLGLQPTPGIAADDLDLMFQARARRLRVELLEAASFLEVKPASRAARVEQQLRRARAYVQVVAGRAAPPDASLGERLRFAAYRRLPLLLPWLLPPALVALAVLAAIVWLVPSADSSAPSVLTALRWLLPALLLLVLALLASPTGRHVRELLSVIRRAQAAERAAPIADRWERASR